MDPKQIADTLWGLLQQHAYALVLAGVTWAVGKAQAQGGPLARFFRK